MNNRAFISIITFFFLLAATALAIAYNRGYKPNFGNGRPVEETGILVATSIPDGAQVFLNNELRTATNNTLNLPEGEYQIKIVKDGYTPWEKNLKIKKGVVSETRAALFPTAPDLRAQTLTGAFSPTLSPDGTSIVYGVASGSAQKQGVWVMDLNEKPLLSQAQTRQIAQTLARASFRWSPDGKQILATIDSQKFLLNSDRLNMIPQDVTITIDSLLKVWDLELKEKERERLARQKEKFLEQANKMTIASWSPDENKILYTATQSATLPQILGKPFVGASTQPEDRELKKGNLYVYDIKEDKNFKLDLPRVEDLSRNLMWFPDSYHLIWIGKDTTSIMEYDGANKATVYAGPFEDSFVYPWPNGSKLIILTNYLNPTAAPNLYTISLK
ncbi:PEGA domain-containing protein [Candidatus Microgenomates bacterium]|nr:PEGA domain-containing protein [Candidatus Microgenomates bacterium]